MESNQPQVIGLKETLRKRALRFRSIAFFALSFSIILLIIAIYLFLYAGELSYRDSIQIIDLKNKQLNELNIQRKVLSEELLQAKGDLTKEKTGALDSGIPGAGAIYKALSDRVQVLNSQLKELDKKISETTKELSNNNTLNLSTSQILTTTITRLIVLGTLIFLVRILINLYKYNMRVAGHYDAISDGIDLLSNSYPETNFIDLFELISPNKIDFGKTPASIEQHTIDLIKALKTN